MNNFSDRGLKKMFLINHGQFKQKLSENGIQDLPDNLLPLSEKGIEQAHAIGEFLKLYVLEYGIDLKNATLWISPYERARQTAEIINQSLEIDSVIEDIFLADQMRGIFSGKSLNAIKKLYPDEFDVYKNYCQNNCKFYYKYPQGESGFDVAIRTRRFLNGVYHDNRTRFVVSHNVPIKTIIFNFFGYSPEWYEQEPNIPDGSVRLIKSLYNNKNEEYIYGKPKMKLLKKD